MLFRPRVEGLENRCLLTTVTNLTDHDPGSLRDAIAITSSGGVVDFQPGLTGTITLITGELAISKDLTITGPGATVITVSGNHAFRIFNIAPTFTVTISGLTIADGTPRNDGGGGILSAGTVTITGCAFRGNATGFPGVHGGAISNSGMLTISGSSFSANSARLPGSNGGAISNSGMLTISESTFQGNHTAAFGRGGAVANSGTLTVADSTFSDGSANFGGGILNRGTLTITNSILSSNRAVQVMPRNPGFGGAIDNFGTLTIASSILSDNSAGFGAAGAVANSGTLTVTDSTFSGNSASFGGGMGIYSFESMVTVTVTNSTFSGNSGGGIDSISGMVTVTVTVTNSTFSGNSSASRGGGISYQGDGVLTITSSTISGNSAGSSGAGGIYRDSGTVMIKNTIVAGNTSPGAPDVFGAVSSQGHNLIGDGTGGSGFADSDFVGTSADPIDPQLEPLGDYGGPTQTMRPLPTSPAVDAGDNTDAPKTDQRGFDRIVNGIIDIGSVELQPDEFGPRGRETLLIAFVKPMAGSWGSVVGVPVSPVARQEVTEPLQYVDATVRRARDLVFGESHRAQRPVPASEWEREKLFF
jgi:hypothetical protein